METNKQKPNKNTSLILVFTGLPASGKDTCLNYLQKQYNADIFSFTTPLSTAVKAFFLEHNRDNLIKMSEAVRAKFGEDILAYTIAKAMEKSQAKIKAVGNARRLADIKYLKKMPGFLLVNIQADIKIRLQRLQQRNEKSDDQTLTFAEFQKQHQRSTEISIAELAAQAKETIDNNNSLSELYKQIDILINKYLYDQ